MHQYELNSKSLGPGQTTRFFTRFFTRQKIEEKIEPFGHLVEWVEWSRVMLSEVWSLSKKSRKIIAVEWKSSRLATLSSKSSESMRSNVSLSGQIFVMVNSFHWHALRKYELLKSREKSRAKNRPVWPPMLDYAQQPLNFEIKCWGKNRVKNRVVWSGPYVEPGDDFNVLFI